MASPTSPRACATLGFEAWQLFLDASSVITMRSFMMMQGGPRAQREGVTMVQEKWQANMELAMALAGGKAGSTAESAAKHSIRHYGKRVSANRRRLAR